MPPTQLVTGLQDIADGSRIAPTYLDIFDSTAPTAIFNTNVLILSLPLDSLAGLTDEGSRFDYKVDVYYDGISYDSMPVLSYDVLRPGLDIFTEPDQAPMLYDLPGNTLNVTYDQANYEANGSLGLLVLHHYNQHGWRTEVVTVEQGP